MAGVLITDWSTSGKIEVFVSITDTAIKVFEVVITEKVSSKKTVRILCGVTDRYLSTMTQLMQKAADHFISRLRSMTFYY